MTLACRHIHINACSAAGWLAAAVLALELKPLGGIVTVSEGGDQTPSAYFTRPDLRQLHERLQLDERDMLKACRGLFRLGSRITFGPQPPFAIDFSPLPEAVDGVAFHQFWRQAQSAGETRPWHHFSLAARAGLAEKFAHPSGPLTYDYGYTLDGPAYKAFVKACALHYGAQVAAGDTPDCDLTIEETDTNSGWLPADAKTLNPAEAIAVPQSLSGLWDGGTLILPTHFGGLGPDLSLAVRAITEMTDLLPQTGTDLIERAEFNRRMDDALDRYRDFHIAAQHLSRDADISLSQPLQTRIDQFAHRGRLISFDGETYSTAEWLGLFMGLGLIPEHVDPLATSRTPDESRALLSQYDRHLEALVSRIPHQNEYLTRAGLTHVRLAG